MTYLKKIEEIVKFTGVRVEALRTKNQVYMDGAYRIQDRTTGTFLVTHGPEADATKNQIARFTLSCFPGCCGAVISCHTSVQPPYQRKGLGALLMKLKEQIAW